MAYSDRYLLFIEYFNNLRFTSAQSTLDEVWLEETGHDKNFYGGLVQLAVSMYHLTSDNPHGAKKIFEKAQEMLLPFGETYQGIRIHDLLKNILALFETSASEKPSNMDYLRRMPRITFEGSLD